MAIPASAKEYYTWGEYGSSMYELIDNCDLFKYSSTTVCDSPEYGLYSNVMEYELTYDDNNNAQSIYRGTNNGNTSFSASSTSATKTFMLAKITCIHYVDGHIVQSITVSSR